MVVVLGDENSNLFEQELANTINGLASQNDTAASSDNRGKSSHEKEIRDFNVENGIP